MTTAFPSYQLLLNQQRDVDSMMQPPHPAHPPQATSLAPPSTQLTPGLNDGDCFLPPAGSHYSSLAEFNQPTMTMFAPWDQDPISPPDLYFDEPPALTPVSAQFRGRSSSVPTNCLYTRGALSSGTVAGQYTYSHRPVIPLPVNAEEGNSSDDNDSIISDHQEDRNQTEIKPRPAYVRRHSTTSCSTTSSAGGNVKPYECSHCKRSFMRRHDLARHTRTHTGDKPYVCPCCLKAFPRSDARGRHFRKDPACHHGPQVLAFIKKRFRYTI